MPDHTLAGDTDAHSLAAGAERIQRPGNDHKRAAITRAALRLFVTQGYGRVSIDNIAAEACVSKRTLYDYFGDKERLFLSVLDEAQAALGRQYIEIVERNLTDVRDVRAALIAFGRELAPTVTRSRQRSAVARLLISESPHFPPLLARWSTRECEHQALADRLARLHERGLLDIPDPAEAACNFGVLVTGRLDDRSLYGRLPLDDTEIDRIVVGGVEVFLRAYSPH